MPKKNKRRKMRRRQPGRPLPLKWEFDPAIPTIDFFEVQPLEDSYGELLDYFILMMEQDEFLAWEAVMAQEQGLRLTGQQRSALSQLMTFDDTDGDQVLYINEMPRPSEPWYTILSKIVPHLLIEPFRTFDIHYEEQCEGWPRIVHCLSEHAAGLSLPDGVTSPIEVVPVELRHKLWLQECFDDLSGLGQSDELTLHNEEQYEFRIADFLESLRRHEESVRYFKLTLDSLLTRVILPDQDIPVLVNAIQQELGLESPSDRLADYL
jgi:hypothetical protein